MTEKKRFNPDWYLLLALLVMVVLFISSSMTYKQQTSVPFLERYLTSKPGLGILKHVSLDYAGHVDSIKTIGYYKLVEFFIRKTAHFSTYFLLGLFLFLGLKDRIRNIFLTGAVCWLASLGYAATDEFHQMLTGGRTPLFQDVMLDGAGALTAIVIAAIVITVKQYKKR